MCMSENCNCGRQRFWPLRRRRFKISLIIIFVGLLLLFWIAIVFLESSNHPLFICETIDVVYTWVNGSDTDFMLSAAKWNGGSMNYDPARFDDKNELKYSLRSLESYAPWVRHIYIVSNQIPHWLDLSNERVSIISHDLLAPNAEFLPTFSSAAIETFLHRIPNLSKRFLYLNDDIFLGTPLFLEDLYTESEGVQIYQAWMVPDCAEDCPWTYIGDGACDRHCYIAACQYDGGDCSAFSGQKHINGIEENISEKELELKQRNSTLGVVRHFPLRKQFRKYKNAASFKEIMRQKNLTNFNYTEVRRLVAAFNEQMNAPFSQTTEASKLKSTVKSEKHFSAAHKSTKDIYSQSLIYTNILLNRHYGFKARNVVAHVGFLLDRSIIDAMQAKFAAEVIATASNRFRSPHLQFAFAYYSFLMSEQRTLSVEEIFDEFDTDNSGTWSDREVRTFMTRMFPIVDWPAMHFFEEVIGNCSSSLLPEDTLNSVIYSTLAYERYEDSNLPTITRKLVAKCSLLADAMSANLASRPKYKFKVNPKRNAHSNFMMLTSNVSEVTYELDRIRRNPRKFNCINDNLDPTQLEDNRLIRNLLEDFYISFFPRPSKFELPTNYRNRFSTWHEYQRWHRRKCAALVIGYSSTILLVLFILRFLVLHKAKIVRRCVNRDF